jgi:hypothetical protein
MPAVAYIKLPVIVKLEEGSRMVRLFIEIIVFLAVNAIVSWLNKVSCLFLSVPTNQRPSIFQQQ